MKTGKFEAGDALGVALENLRRGGKELHQARLNSCGAGRRAVLNARDGLVDPAEISGWAAEQHLLTHVRQEQEEREQAVFVEMQRGLDARRGVAGPRWRPLKFLALYRDWMENKAGEMWIHAGVPVPDIGPFSLMDPREFQALISTTSYPEPVWRQPGFEPYPAPQVSLVEAIRWTPTEFEQPQFMLEASMTNAATETAEGIAAPESAFDYVPTSTYVKRIPVTLPASRQALDDVEVLEELLSGRLLYQIKVRLQSQVIAGDGSLGALDGNLCGILNTPNVISITKGSGLQPQVDSIAAAISAIRVATQSWYEPSDLVIFPTDAEELAETKDAAGRYVFPPGEPLTPFGLRTTITTSASVGQPLVGCIDALQGYVRDDVLADISDSHADFFTRFLVMLRAEARVGFAVRQPLAWACIENFNA